MRCSSKGNHGIHGKRIQREDSCPIRTSRLYYLFLSLILLSFSVYSVYSVVALSLLIGKTRVKQAPPSGWLRAERSPPCSWRMRRLLLSPRPVPDRLVLAKAVNSRLAASGRVPGPESGAVRSAVRCECPLR